MKFLTNIDGCGNGSSVIGAIDRQNPIDNRHSAHGAVRTADTFCSRGRVLGSSGWRRQIATACGRPDRGDTSDRGRIANRGIFRQQRPISLGAGPCGADLRRRGRGGRFCQGQCWRQRRGPGSGEALFGRGAAKVIVAIDHEGGAVQRLVEAHGCARLPSALQVATDLPSRRRKKSVPKPDAPWRALDST